MLITGASSGIGEAIAREAARRKYDLVIVSRTKERLDALASDLTAQHDIDAEVLAADLTNTDDLHRVVARIDRGDIDILINNAGFGSSGPFVELDIDNEMNEIDLNIRALVRLTHCAAEHMVAKKMGTIVNVSSIASYQPMVGNAVYGASKAFVTSFSHALREELRDTSVKVMVVCPGPTTTEFFERSKWLESSKEGPIPAPMWQSSADVAKAVFSGIDKHKSVVIPGFSNKILAGISSSLPGTVTRKITAFVAKGRRTR
jgi:short-subunit dehydrogenase